MTRKRTLGLGVALGIALVTAVLGTAWAFAQDQEGEAAVSMESLAFRPAVLRVPIGTTVRWTNRDAVAHTVTGRDGSWGSGTLEPGQEYTFTFAQEGAYAYTCIPHPFMQGLVLVGEAQAPAGFEEAPGAFEWMRQHMDAVHGPAAFEAMHQAMGQTLDSEAVASMPCHQQGEGGEGGTTQEMRPALGMMGGGMMSGGGAGMMR